MRLFLGIELPYELKKRIADFLGPIKKRPQGWENIHDYHQTLLFIGETEENVVFEIKRRMKNIKFQPFKLTTDCFSFFPRRIMYLSFQPSLDLFQLKKTIDTVYPEWIRPAEKEFIPHVTVKRWQRHEYDHLVNEINAREFPAYSFDVKKIALFESRRNEQLHKYHVVDYSG